MCHAGLSAAWGRIGAGPALARAGADSKLERLSLQWFRAHFRASQNSGDLSQQLLDAAAIGDRSRSQACEVLSRRLCEVDRRADGLERSLPNGAYCYSPRYSPRGLTVIGLWRAGQGKYTLTGRCPLALA